jgi:hypothetical protein
MPEQILPTTSVESIVHELALFACVMELVQGEGTPADDPRRDGCRYAQNAAAVRLKAYDPAQRLLTLFLQGWTTLHRLDPSWLADAVRDAGTRVIPIFGGPVASARLSAENQAAVRELLNLRWLLDHAKTNRTLPPALPESAMYGLEYAIAFIDARIRLRDPDGSVERRIRASVSRPGGDDILSIGA